MKIKLISAETCIIDILYNDTPLKYLSAIHERKARKIFRSLKIAKASKYKFSNQIFFQISVYSISSGKNEIEKINLNIDNNDFIYIHLHDKSLPIGVLLCKSKNGYYLGSYISGTSFIEKIKMEEVKTLNRELAKGEQPYGIIYKTFDWLLTRIPKVKKLIFHEKQK